MDTDKITMGQGSQALGVQISIDLPAGSAVKLGLALLIPALAAVLLAKTIPSR